MESKSSESPAVIALDTNILLRLLTHDDPEQLAAMGRFLTIHAGETYLVPDIALVEAVWTLRSAFGWERAPIAAALRRLAAKPDVQFADPDRVAAAIQAFEAGNDFADELIVSFAHQEGCSALASFDTALHKCHPDFVVQPE